MIQIIILYCLLIGCHRPTISYGDEGKIINGKATLRCEKPKKVYGRKLDNQVETKVKELSSVPTYDIDAKLKTTVNRLAKYSKRGLDIDLILFRICEMSINRGFTNEQTAKLIEIAIKSWNNSIESSDNKNDSLANLNKIQADLTTSVLLSHDSITASKNILFRVNFKRDIKKFREEYEIFDKAFYGEFKRSYKGVFFDSTLREGIFPGHILKDYPLGHIFKDYPSYLIGEITISISDFWRTRVSIFNTGNDLTDSSIGKWDGVSFDAFEREINQLDSDSIILLKINKQRKINAAVLLNELRKTREIIMLDVYYSTNEEDKNILKYMKILNDNIFVTALYIPYKSDADLWYEVLLKRVEPKIIANQHMKIGRISWEVINRPNIVKMNPF